MAGHSHASARRATTLWTMEIVVPAPSFEMAASAANGTGQKSFATGEGKPNEVTQNGQAEGNRGNADPQRR